MFPLSVAIFMPQTSYAGSLTIGKVLDNVTGYLTGDVAKGAGVLAIVISGYMCFSGQGLPKKQFASIAIGLGLILGGSQMYQMLVG